MTLKSNLNPILRVKAFLVAIAIAGDGENPVLDRDFLPVPVSVPFLALVGGQEVVVDPLHAAKAVPVGSSSGAQDLPCRYASLPMHRRLPAM